MSTHALSAVSDLYLSSFSDELRSEFQSALQIAGLDGEIAMLRVHLIKLNKREPDNFKLILRGVHLIERLVKCNFQIQKENTRTQKPAPPAFNIQSLLSETVAPEAVLDVPNPEMSDPVSEPSTATSPAPTGTPTSPSPITSPPVAAVAPHRTWSTSSVAKKAPSRLPDSAQSLFRKKKHKKH
jgi:hypothetical protein